jgi:hypothetical protein
MQIDIWIWQGRLRSLRSLTIPTPDGVEEKGDSICMWSASTNDYIWELLEVKEWWTL